MRRAAFFLAAFAIAGTWSAAGKAAAQCRLCSGVAEEEIAEVPPPMTIEVETSLDFDRLVLTGTTGGVARLGPDGSRSASGAIGDISGRAMAGTIVIRGEPNRSVRVDLPDRIELEGWNGSQILIERVSSDAGSAPRLDSNGRLVVRFGGELHVQGEAEGDYRGHVPVTVEYL